MGFLIGLKNGGMKMSDTINQAKEAAIRRSERHRVAAELARMKVCATGYGDCTGDCEEHWQTVLDHILDETESHYD